MVGKMSMGLDLEILLKFPNVAREPGALLYYFFIFSFLPFFIILFLLYIYIFSLITFSLFFFSSFTPLEL
jgi:hypothetical protein